VVAVLKIPLLLVLVLGSAASLAQPTRSGSIFSCIGPNGKPMTGDRELTGCVGDQFEHGPDGARRRVVPPQRSDIDRSADDDRRRQAEADAKAKAAQDRQDRQLVLKYPDPPAVEAARKSEVATTQEAIHKTEERIRDLKAKRKPLLEEDEFYNEKTRPGKLKADLDANDAALAAQASIRLNQEQELKRINAKWDETLVRLKELWPRLSAPRK
jgi:hypothetical protein